MNITDLYWDEIPGQHTQTFNITNTKTINDHWPHDDNTSSCENYSTTWSPIQAHPKRTMFP